MIPLFEAVGRFLRELRRRNVYKVAVTYLTVAFVALQAVSLLIPATTLPGWAHQFLLALLIVGFPIAVVLAWAFELTPNGVKRTEPSEAGETKDEDGEARGWPVRYRDGPAMSALTAVSVLAALGLGGWYLLGDGGTGEITDR